MGVTEAEGLTTTAKTASSSTSATSCCYGWLVVDFDGTCSEKDTTPILPQLASILSNDSRHQQEKRLSTFVELETEFFNLYNTAKQSITCPKTMSLDEALDTLDDASNVVTTKVSNSGILRGLDVSTKQFQKIFDKDKEINHSVKLRSGCAEVIKMATKTTTLTTTSQKQNKWKLGVLSINWCPSLIDAALVQRIFGEDGNDKYTQDSDISVSRPPIWSNSIDEDGVVTLHVPGALAKKQRISELKKSISSSSSKVIYVGDSSTDLAALVEADIGILIGQSQSTIAIAKRWGIQVIPLKQWHRHRHEHHEQQRTMVDTDNDNNEKENTINNQNNSILWTVDTWSEIGDFLFNILEKEKEEEVKLIDPSIC